MTTFTAKLDALADHYTSELQKLQQAMREQIGDYVREEFAQNVQDYSGVRLNIWYSLEYESFVVFVQETGFVDNQFYGLIPYIEAELNKCSEEMQQAFISEYIVEF